MELRQLETFARIVAEGSFTRAADSLAITQPAATRQIGALERELRTTLFDRLGRRVALTAAGQELHRYATQILRLAAEAKATVADVAAGKSGRLSVGASSTAATYLLPGILSRYRSLYPGVELSVRTGPSPYITERVAAGDVDLGVVMDLTPHPDLVAIELAHYANVLVAAPSHPLAAGALGPIDARSALSGAAMIVMQAGASLRGYSDRLMADHGVQARITIEVDSVETIKKMVAENLGVAILPRLAIEGEVASGKLVALDVAGVTDAAEPIGIIHRDDKYLTSSMKAFIDVMRREMGAAATQ